jgi:hypothetical protein
VALALKVLARVEQEQGERLLRYFQLATLGCFSVTGTGISSVALRGTSIRNGRRRSGRLGVSGDGLAMIGGNHEPWHKLRVFDPGYFGGRLTYTNAGVLPHNLSGLIVVGLSGIPREPKEERSAETAWQEIVAQCRCRKIGRKELAYYRSQDVTAAATGGSAHILLTHDWPADPDMDDAGAPRAERLIASAVRPKFHFCGHHHRSAAFAIERTEVRALNMIADNASQDRPKPGWASLGTWDGQTPRQIGFWPHENIAS